MGQLILTQPLYFKADLANSGLHFQWRPFTCLSEGVLVHKNVGICFHMPNWYWVGYFASWWAVIFTSGVGFCFVVNIGKEVNCKSSSGYASQWLFLVIYIMIQGCMTSRSVGHWKTLSNGEVPDLGSELHPSYIFVILLYYMMLSSNGNIFLRWWPFEGSTGNRLISLTVVSDTELWPSLCLWMFGPHEGQTNHRHIAAHRDCFVKAFSIHSTLINIVVPLKIILVSISYLWN